VNEKYMAKHTEDESIPELGWGGRPSEAWFPSNRLMTIEEDAQSAHLRCCTYE